MNRLRKIAKSLWLNKERMVLAVMVIILIFRVRAVVQPEMGPPRPPVKLAGRELPADVKPPLPPPPVDVRPPRGDWSSLWEQNPLSWKEPGKEVVRDDDGKGRSRGLDDLEVLRITKGRGGKFRAQIKTASSKKWYDEGDHFESYELRSIDPDTLCCEIRATSIQRVVTVCIEDDN